MLISFSIHRHFELFSPEHSSENRCKTRTIVAHSGASSQMKGVRRRGDDTEFESARRGAITYGVDAQGGGGRSRADCNAGYDPRRPAVVSGFLGSDLSSMIS
jgi:hypothetical protein